MSSSERPPSLSRNLLSEIGVGIAALGTVLVGTRPAGARDGYPMASPPEATVAEKADKTEQTEKTAQNEKTERADSGAGEAD